MKSVLVSILLTAMLYSCQTKVNSKEIGSVETTLLQHNNIVENIKELPAIDTFFNRTDIKARLKSKIALNQPLIVHLYIPLCDNINQGIVPTSKTLGDGLNLKTNLYWATSGGTKSFFKKQPEWKTVYNSFNIDSNVLERIVFKKFYNNTSLYLVADAYRGDRMEETINDFLGSISNNRHDSIFLQDSSTIFAGGYADLIMFNGHNGVMDNITIKPWENRTDKRTDIVMNACLSYGYLQNELMRAGGYPLVRTNTLLYPGAYVLEQIIDDWVVGISEVQLCLNAGRVYCTKHNCGKGTKVYKTGW